MYLLLYHFSCTLKIMKTQRLEIILAGILLTILAGIFIHAPLSVWLGSLFPDIAVIFKVWKEALLVIALLLMVALVTVRRSWRLFTRDTLLLLVAGYAALHLITIALVSNEPLAVLAGIAIDLRYLLYFSLVYMFLRMNRGWAPWFIKIGVIGVVVVVGFATLQLFLPKDILTHIGYGPNTIAPYMTVDDDSSFVRVNSTLRGPNPLGALAVMALAGVVAWGRKYKLWKNRGKSSYILGIMFVASVVALWLSYSRSAWVAGIFAAIAVGLFAHKKFTLSSKKLLAIVGGVTVVIIAIVAARQSTFISTVVFHDNQTTGAEITSNEQHVQSWQQGIERIIANPLGEGVGSAGSASLYSSQPTVVESQYLFVAHEVGVAGLILFLAITGVVLALLYRGRAYWLSLSLFFSGIGLLLIGVLLPVWADDTVAMVWWGMAAAALQMKGAKRGSVTSKQKAA